uniref:Glutamine dumper 3 n=1 Tax=Tradescantia hirsutiflora TaxID=428262 RepID=A0A1B1X425_9LILI|nr:glutamine dumper 3 [Tradescantia hirsutiflora]
MRPGASFSASTTSQAQPPAPHYTVPHSPWHSPVPYLFGGLAAMLGLIALALLILACSYWKLSGYLDSATDSEGRNSSEDTEGKFGDGEATKPAPFFEERFLVIMPGDLKPTQLATPVASRVASFDEKSVENCGSEVGVKLQAGDENRGESEGQQ